MRPLLLLAAALPLYSQVTIDTFAGGAIRSGVPAQNAFLESVAAVAWDPAGNVVFCDQTNNVIRRVRTDGILETIAGTGVTGFGGDGGPATAALLNFPAAPVYDPAGNLYFADQGNRRVRRIETSGIITTVAGDGIPYAAGMDTSGPALERSLGGIELAIGLSGNLYILDTPLNRVRLLTADGRLQDFFAFSADVSDISSLTSDGAGNLYAIQTSGFLYEAIVRIAPDGTLSTFREWQASPNPGVALVGPIAADTKGNVYGIQGGSIVRFSPDGSDTPIAGAGQGYASSPDGPALPSVIHPSLLAVDAQGNVAFADTFEFVNHYLSLAEIREVSANSKLQTLAGSAPRIVPDGTPLLNAWFEQPSAIAFSRTGDLYVAEFRACLIRKISASGVLSTFAGTGNCAYPAPSGPNAKTADIVQPYSLAVDSQNRVWVTDYYLNFYSIAQDGTISPILQTPVRGGNGLLAVDAKDRVYVLGIDSLYRLLADGSFQLVTPAPSASAAGWVFAGGTGIGTDASGNVYFTTSGTVFSVGDNGTFVPVSANQFDGGNSLAVDSAQRFWQGEYTDIAVTGSAGASLLGNLSAGFSGDGGPAMAARFSNVSSLALSPAGDLYMVDGNRIRKLSGISSAIPAPAIDSGGIVNAASYLGGAVSPGELIAIFGSNFGAANLDIAAPVNNAYPSALGRTRVLFGGYPGTITAVSANQIDVFVPAAVSVLGATVQVVVEVDDAVSPPVTVPVAAVSPDTFTADSSGSGQGAILNQDRTVNSAANPAARGSIVSIFGTGLGLSTPQLPDGTLAISTPYPIPQATVTVSIGGQPAGIAYAGAAPFLPAGVFQINARIPAAIAPGNAAVTVSAGAIASAGQVTVAVK
jgi:uncharacterized protein (TIGR03437 family)